MNKYLAAVLAIAAFTAVLSIAFPRLAPIAVRVGLVALIITAALWIYEYFATRPPPLAPRILELVKTRGPLSTGDITRELGAAQEEVEEALDYLVKKRLVRKYEKDGVTFFDL
jgi:DNA-binding transcriptional ArsR family regulator